jgi:hypothetical protein
VDPEQPEIIEEEEWLRSTFGFTYPGLSLLMLCFIESLTIGQPSFADRCCRLKLFVTDT